MLKKFVERMLAAQSEVEDKSAPEDPLALAAAALLVEAAATDGEIDDKERALILTICAEQFSLERTEAERLLSDAEAEIAKGGDLHPYTQLIKNRFEEAERIKIIEMLWQVVYSDGVLHDYEANLLRRIGGLIYVSDRARGEARKRVMAKMGIASKP